MSQIDRRDFLKIAGVGAGAVLSACATGPGFLRSGRSSSNIVVIGASAGGVEALRAVLGNVPKDLPASVLVVLHLSPDHRSVLPHILGTVGPLPATHPIDGESLQKGHVYVAPPDHHLVVDDGVVRLTRSPREGGHRPAIDTLFRTAPGEGDDARKGKLEPANITIKTIDPTSVVAGSKDVIVKVTGAQFAKPPHKGTPPLKSQQQCY